MKFDWLSVFTELNILNEKRCDDRIITPFFFINYLWDKKDETDNS